jgi:hypothetical protein
LFLWESFSRALLFKSDEISFAQQQRLYCRNFRGSPHPPGMCAVLRDFHQPGHRKFSAVVITVQPTGTWEGRWSSNVCSDGEPSVPTHDLGISPVRFCLHPKTL